MVDEIKRMDRFTAAPGSMEVLSSKSPISPAERNAWKNRTFLQHYGGTMTNYAVQAAAGERLMLRYLAYARQIGVKVVGGIGDCGMEVTAEQAALLDKKWQEICDE